MIKKMNEVEHILRFSDQDRPGIIAQLANIIFRSGGNIITSEQYTSPEGLFLLRFHYRGPDVSAKILEDFPKAHFSCQARRVKKAVVFVSKTSHCLFDLLWRGEEATSPFRITSVISNQENNRSLVEKHNIPFYYVKQGEDRASGEEAILKRLDPNADFVILARYMRILSGDFLARAKIPFINVHHSFLPAFPGANPYRKAYDRGVKTIGATAHYVIEELDAGPIIAQRTTAVTHRDSLEDLVEKGREEERLVLAEAVLAHAEDRIIQEAGKTVVFAR